jgi:ubiquinone/menaquinone biosynthesis C-methylase UbiE
LPEHSANDHGATPAFETVAPGYDARAGLPPGAGAAIAAAIVHLGEVAADDLVLELGAGTGEIGAHLAALAPGYVGLDNSPAMLDHFRAKAELAAPRLLVANADDPWPLPASSTQVIFASRVIHLLQPDHVVREALRVARPGGYLMLGRVHREPGSLKERLQHQRQTELRAHGISPRQGERGAREVIERLIAAGGESLGRHVVAEWQGETAAAEILAQWSALSRMGSVEVDPALRTTVLAQLHDWARSEIGDIERQERFRETYAVDVVRMPQTTARS